MNATLQRLTGWRKESANPDSLSDCGLIIPTFKRPREIIELLTLLATLPDAPGEVLVVDGSSENNVEEAVRNFATQDLRFDLVYVKSPAGLTRQRNVGLDACSREFIFFLDDDCLPLPGYFREIRQVFLNDTRKEVGAVRGFLTNGINKPLTRLWRLRFALGLVSRGEPGQYFHSGTSTTWDMVPCFHGVRRIDVLAGGASAYRREVFAKHRFSEFFYGYAQGEDLEMSLRIGEDWKLLACGDAFVNHNHAEHGRPAGFRRGRMAIRNRFFIWKRHSPQASAKDRVRFWGDSLLSVFYYLFGFATHPWWPYFLGYATGTVCGALECHLRPPRHEEPVAQQQYEFRFEEIFEETPTAPCVRQNEGALLQAQ
jgi:GT2 family glycosyltransferase